MTLEIANRLVALRKARGLSQEELASELHLSRQAVSKWERGEASPDVDNVILLSRLYGVSIDELLGSASVITEDPAVWGEEEEPAPQDAETEEELPDPEPETAEEVQDGFAGVAGIKLDVRADVRLMPAAGEVCTVSLEGARREREQCSIYAEGGTLYIETPREAHRGIAFFRGRTLIITVGVPASVSSVTGVLLGGDLEMRGIRAKRIAVKTGGGDINASDCGVKAFSAVTGGGDIALARIRASAAEISSGGGDVTASGIDAEETLTVSTGGGDISVSGSAAEADARSGGGDVELRLTAGTITAKTGGGDVLISCTGAKAVSAVSGGGDISAVIKDCTGVKAELQTMGGEAKLIWQGETAAAGRKINAAAGDGSVSVSMRSGGGDIRVEA